MRPRGGVAVTHSPARGVHLRLPSALLLPPRPTPDSVPHQLTTLVFMQINIVFVVCSHFGEMDVACGLLSSDGIFSPCVFFDAIMLSTKILFVISFSQSPATATCQTVKLRKQTTVFFSELSRLKRTLNLQFWNTPTVHLQR